MDDISCDKCDSKFSKKKNLYAHIRTVHNLQCDVQSERKKNNLNRCSLCDETFSQKSNLTRHLKNIHQTVEENRKKYTSRIKCPYVECTDSCANYAELRKHLNNAHQIQIQIYEHMFSTRSEFLKWKTEMENRTLSSYVKTTPVRLGTGEIKEYFNCHRSYDYLPSGNGSRALKRNGSNKIGKACPSRIVLLESNDGHITIQFYETHAGHSNNVGKIFLNKETRLEIAGKLKEGVTFQKILDDIRDCGAQDDELKRILRLKRKDIHNISRDFNINHSKRHYNDAISVDNYIEIENLSKINKSCINNDYSLSAKKKLIKNKAELVLGLCDKVELGEEECDKVMRHFDQILEELNKVSKSNFNEH